MKRACCLGLGRCAQHKWYEIFGIWATKSYLSTFTMFFRILLACMMENPVALLDQTWIIYIFRRILYTLIKWIYNRMQMHKEKKNEWRDGRYYCSISLCFARTPTDRLSEMNKIVPCKHDKSMGLEQCFPTMLWISQNAPNHICVFNAHILPFLHVDSNIKY